MSFQFPANPADGDIVVRGNLLATYDQPNNTWTVGEIPTYPGVPGPVGPEGPRGPQGNPGSGVNVNGIVATFADLPVDPETGSFWIVDETNTLYYWDGVSYYDLGSPIRGPKGEQGETGATGDDGMNGLDGRGWYGTAIDDSNGEYKIVFQSNDGLEFTTDDLKGGSWEPVYATADTPGLIKLGAGLDLADDGSAEVKDTFVKIETVPLGKENNVSFSLNFIPATVIFDNTSSGATSIGWGSRPAESQTGGCRVPDKSNAAIVYYFVASDMSPRVQPGWQAPGLWPVHARIVSNLSVAGATWTDGLGLGIPMTHNLGANTDQTRMSSNQPTMKVGQIIYPVGTTQLTFTQSVTATTLKSCYVNYGRGRVVVVPYLDAEGQVGLQRKERALSIGRSMFAGTSYSEADIEGSKDFYEPNPIPIPEDEITRLNSGELKGDIEIGMRKVDLLVAQQFPSGSVYAHLMSQRQALIDVRDLPGTFEQLNEVVQDITTDINSYDEYSFRFE